MKPYKAKEPFIVRLSIPILLFSAAFSGVLKQWDAFGLSLGVLLIVIIGSCNRGLTIRMDQRFDRLEKLIKPEEEKPDEEKEQMEKF